MKPIHCNAVFFFYLSNKNELQTRPESNKKTTNMREQFFMKTKKHGNKFESAAAFDE